MSTGMRVRRWRVAPLLAVAALPVLLSGCEDILVDGPPQELGNIRAELDVLVVESDSGIAVNGRQVINHPPGDRALWLDRFERFDLGGFPEIGYAQDARHALSWRVMLTHAHPPEQRGDSTILRYHDHGDAWLGGHPMDRLTDLPQIGPGGPPVRFENFIRYILTPFVEVEWMHGGTTRFVDLPVHADLTASRPVAVETGGSAGVLPTHTMFAAVPLTRLTRVENDGELDLRVGGVPVMDVDHALVLGFDAPLDPGHAYIVLHPMNSHAQPGTRAAFIQTRSPTRRVVIPPHVLLELVAHAPTQTAYRVVIVEIRVQEGVFAGTLTPADASPEDFVLPFVQRAETSLHLYLRKR